jgi:hypothetical protein
MLSRPLGLSPVDINAIYITLGAGHPLTYAETGYAVSAILGHQIKERHFRPRFLSMCRRGLITFADWKQMELGLRFRRVVDVPRCVDVIRDVQIHLGADYAYYKYFDPYVDYEKQPEKMDRFLKGPLSVEGKARKMGRKQLYEQHWKNHLKDPKKFRWV